MVPITGETDAMVCSATRKIESTVRYLGIEVDDVSVKSPQINRATKPSLFRLVPSLCAAETMGPVASAKTP